MKPRFQSWLAWLAGASLALGASAFAQEAKPSFRAGASSVDISPVKLPVVVNAMFTERSADKVVDRLYAKGLALESGPMRMVICVVDTCMVPRDLIDRAKEEASRATGIAVEQMLVSATHTHSAPSAMGCLGSRVDPDYAAWLPSKIAEAIIGAARNLQPAVAGWIAIEDWDHTFNRRWIRRPDRMLNDPFGTPNVRANMHPGHESPDAVGPSGPVDPGLTVLGISTTAGRPLAVLANYSQHYYGSPLLSSDYYGRFAKYLAEGLKADPSFVGIMSQGTSGDQMWMDYGAPRREIGYDAYGKELAERVLAAYQKIVWRPSLELAMAETKLPLRYRVPDETRLAWARKQTEALGQKLPSNHAEIYAWEAIYLHERQKTELKLQAARLGFLGITAIPNEVYAITGLKLKEQSPLAVTMNISLANGAEGYIPPPEQHKLGGYTTWPARTAGLEVEAEPKIVEALLGLLEKVSGKTRRPLADENGPYAQAVLEAKPVAYWRLNEMLVPTARDASGNNLPATYEDGVALYLPGVGSGSGVSPHPALTTSKFSGGQVNRAAHFAGGRLRARIGLGDRYTIAFWFWNGLPPAARAVTGYLFSRGTDQDAKAIGEHLGLGGTYEASMTGKLFLFNGNERNQTITGATTIGLRQWHHVAFVREGKQVRVHLDGAATPELAGAFEHTVPMGEQSIFLGGRNDRLFGLEGKLDEAAIFDRALSGEEIGRIYSAAGLPPPAQDKKAAGPASPPLSPAESLKKIQVAAGYRVELVAAEPLTIDPVAIDWDAAGRLWVAEMADYPLGLDGKGKPGGRVRVLEDLDGDGVYDKSTLFADGLNFPNGLLTWRDGVIVTAAPEILLLRDTDGDGKADSRETLVSGLLQGNQQLRANGLRWGLDNWVYCAAGGHHGNYGTSTKLRTKAGEIQVGSRDFRFRPDTGELEPQSGPSQFGRNRDDWGRWFGTQNSRPLWHYVLADHYLRRNPHVPAPDPVRQVVVPLNPKVWPASSQEKRYHSFNEAGHFTSACGGMIYRDELLFPNRPAGEEHAFTCEPFHNLVQHNVITDAGVSFTARRAKGEETNEFFASADRWCRPVMVRTGPDGALWIVDMYRYMIEHPEWLPEAGKAELLPHYRLGEDRGRIYRVHPIAGKPRPIQRLDKLSPTELVHALDSPNEWQRDKAHQLILQRGSADQETKAALISALAPMATGQSNPLARLHALCALDGIKALAPGLIERALGDAHPGVRENALRLAEKHPTPAVIAAAAELASDPNAKVRLQLAFTLGEWKESSAGQALAALAVRDYAEPFALAAILSSAVPHCGAVTEAAAAAGGEALATLFDPLSVIAMATGNRQALASLLKSALTPSAAGFTKEQLDNLARFFTALRREKKSIEQLAEPRDSLTQSLQLIPSAMAWARKSADDAGAAIQTRIAAAACLAADPATEKEIRERLETWLSAQQPIELQRAALAILAKSTDERVPEIILSRISAFSPEIQTAAAETLLTREPWTYAFVTSMEQGVRPALTAARQSQLLQHSSKRVRELAGKILAPPASRAEVMAQFQPALQLSGQATRGEAIFLKLCASCHQWKGTGQEIGPNLSSVASHPPEKLLANILNPSADVQPGFQAYQCQLTDGTELYGLIVAETSNSIQFKLVDGSTRLVLRKDIASIKSGSLSLMPEGLEAGLTPQDMADLLQFVKQWQN